MKVFGYIRVSGVSQLDGGGPERQQEAIMAFCAANKLELVNVFTEAISGTVENEDRPIFTQMLDCVDAAGVEAIVVERMDRIARKVVVSERLCLACWNREIMLYSTDQGLTDNASNAEPTRVLFRQLLAIMAEYERTTIVNKMEAGAAAAVKKDKRRAKGNKPYGLTAEEQAILAQIRTLRAQDPPLSYAKIAADLTLTGYRNRKGNLWTAQNVHDVLKNAENRAPAL